MRGLVPWPGAFSYLPGQPQPHLLKIWQAEVVERSGPAGEVLQADKTGIVVGCGRDALRILILQREGGRRLPAQEFLAGHPLLPGQSWAEPVVLLPWRLTHHASRIHASTLPSTGNSATVSPWAPNTSD